MRIDSLTSLVIAVDNGRPQAEFCVCVGLPVQMHEEQIELGGHFVSVSQIYLVMMHEFGFIVTQILLDYELELLHIEIDSEYRNLIVFT